MFNSVPAVQLLNAIPQPTNGSQTRRLITDPNETVKLDKNLLEHGCLEKGFVFSSHAKNMIPNNTAQLNSNKSIQKYLLKYKKEIQ
jgi:hypothetical protein